MHFDDVTVLVVSVCCFILVALIAVSISYVRATKTLARYLRMERPDDWNTILTLGGGREPNIASIADYGLFGLVKGTTRLPIPEDKYRHLLWSVRRRLFVWLGLLLALVIMIGWAFRDTLS